MSKKTIPEKHESLNEIKPGFLISLVVTIVFAIIPAILQNLNLNPKISILLMMFLGIFAIIIIYFVFKHANSQIAKRLTFYIQITNRKAKFIFIFLILFVGMSSVYIFWRNYNLELNEYISYNSYRDMKSNILNLSIEFSKLSPYLDTVRFNKKTFHEYNKRILDEGCKYLEEEYELKEDDLIISMFKKIHYNDKIYVYEQNWSGDIEVDKCFILSDKSLIGCAFNNENKELFILFKPDLTNNEMCAWDIKKDKKAIWHKNTNDIFFNESVKCNFNTEYDDYQRKGILCFYSNLDSIKSEIGICLDFRETPNDDIYHEEKVHKTILDIAQKIMKHPDEFYSETDFDKLRYRIKLNCKKQNFKPDYPIKPYEL